MKPSNVQTKSVIFLGVEINQNQNYDAEKQPAWEFDWGGVNIGVKSQFKKNKSDDFSVFLQIIVDNEEGKQAPYTIDVSVLGRFEYIGTDEPEVRNDLIVVNGLSILYGTIREMVTTISSRMPFSEMCLPGANFLDHKPSLNKEAEKTKIGPSPKKRTAAKKQARLPTKN
ncbi:MAG: protein-export chaperone SecB [Alcaligenes pakistanensis]